MLVLGHTNPDCDSIAGAISLAELLTKKGTPATAVAQGEPNPEASFLLNMLNLEAPEIRTSIAGEDVWLIDYSDWGQAPVDAKKANIRGIVDHHKLGDITTAEPLECWIRPVGCSCTIVYSMYKDAGLVPSKSSATLMLGAILSDTVKFNSPTFTPIDRTTADELAVLAGVDDLNAFADAQFAAKSDVGAVPADELVLRDQKIYEIAGKKFAIAQLELTSLAPVIDRLDELQASLEALKAANNYHTALVILTDITSLNSKGLIVSDEAELVTATLGGTFEGSIIDLPGVVSRKKQVMPPLQKQFDQ
ncbi:manganese-dependent inorganic pyrophosphatase [Alginatibacterium sediminis]|uniref:inorganic diphosphatase n=1 Tax=Alginatibacterium sediminis TaxID=2164068 RepID=A0A420EG72_9ALTE|nr:manganese-dependent inorganic pyrophosphatase [Alginatibacterium sediminis]RKF19705.1 manganese-dependent inorganic pyrophosphatase [Alginatibacterium sediminis]